MQFLFWHPSLLPRNDTPPFFSYSWLEEKNIDGLSIFNVAGYFEFRTI